MIGLEVKKFLDETLGVEKAVQDGTNRALAKAGYKIMTAARESIETAADRHDKSPPGTPPHTRRGQLRRAIRYDVDKVQQLVVVGPLASLVGESGQAHEFGGEFKGEQYPERPFMGPALEKNLEAIPAFWSSEVHS